MATISSIFDDVDWRLISAVGLGTFLGLQAARWLGGSVNIFVLANNHHVFQSFLHDYRAREHYGSGGNREGQVHFLHSADQLRGMGSALVLVYGPLLDRQKLSIVDEAQEMWDVSVVRVPLSRREQHARSKHVGRQL